MRNNGETIKVGVVGTGYVSRHFVRTVCDREDLYVSSVLTRRAIDECGEYPRPDLLVNSRERLVEGCDVVFECSGDPLHAAEVVDTACRAGRPVVTIDAEFHVTAGSYFTRRGIVTEAEGDQPGSLAVLHERMLDMGFQPLVYGNLKGFLNHTPTRSEMNYWADRKGITLDKVTSFTDGTKLQVEQALVANGLGATLAEDGMLGLEIDDVEDGGRRLAERANELNRPISDYLLFSEAPHGVFIAAEHRNDHREFLRHVKLGDGPIYIVSRNDILVHLQVPRTIRRVYHDRRPLLNNSAVPTINVVTVAKRPLPKGTVIPQGIGSFKVRGECRKIVDHPNAVPVGLLQDAEITREIPPGGLLTFDDVNLPDSLALRAWQHTRRQVLTRADSAEALSPAVH